MKKSRYLAIIIAVLLVGVLLYARRPRTWRPIQEKNQIVSISMVRAAYTGEAFKETVQIQLLKELSLDALDMLEKIHVGTYTDAPPRLTNPECFQICYQDGSYELLSHSLTAYRAADGTSLPGRLDYMDYDAFQEAWSYYAGLEPDAPASQR